MVERTPEDLDLDTIFRSLAYSIRWDILDGVADEPTSVSALAEPPDVTLAAVSTPLRVLEDAGLIDVERDGRVRRSHLYAAPLGAVFGWFTRYRAVRADRFDALAIPLEDEE